MENLPVLLDLVEKRCPKLCPVFFPNGLSENQILKRLEEKGKIPEEKEVCEICESEEGQMFPQVMMDYDLPSRKCSVSEVKYICPLCKYAMNVNKVMELLVNSNSSSEEIDTLIRHFLLVNGHNPDDTALMEEIVSSCYSLRVIFKSFLSPSVEYRL